MGYTDATLHDHVTAEHGEASTEVVSINLVSNKIIIRGYVYCITITDLKKEDIECYVSQQSY